MDSLGYDASGNVVFKVRKVGTGAPLDTYRFTYGASSNRLAQETLDGGGVSPVQYSYDADGSRWAEWPSPQDNSFRERWYYYDALGRPSGLGRYRPNGLNQEHICRYDSDGQMFMPCELSAPALGFDGASVVTANTNSLWHFVQGDGLDDPLAAVGTAPSLGTQEIFYVTDGAGRVLVAVDSAGNLPTAATGVEGWQGWSYHGAATRTQGFTANRLSNATAPEYSYYRNRLYDQRTGRWTQEDPLGVAGGLNLYQFNGNNPVTFTDPFGTCKVDVRFSRVAGGAANHAYIVTTAPDNTRTYFRGGPSKGGPSGGSSGQFGSASGGSASDASGSNSDSGNSSSPGSGQGDGGNGPWGTLTTISGAYEPGTVDYEEGSPPTMNVLSDDKPCDKYNQSFGLTLQRIDAKGIPYNPFTTNSNAVVGTALRQADLPLAPRPVWAPGFNRNLLP